MTQYRFEYLISLYKAGELDPEEWEELRAAIREGVHDAWLSEDIRALLEEEGVHETWNAGVEAGMWQEILKGRKATEAVPVRRMDAGGRRIGLGRSWLGWTAAAAVILVCIGLIWLLRPGGSEKGDPAGVRAIASDIRPGGTKAILTLAGGRQIVLDSSVNGQIARQGGATVIKLNGMISYKGGDGSGETLYNTITTPRGGQYELILPDGSRVWLNSSSALRFPTAFGKGQRQVELKGEGYFEITRDARRPFTVMVNEMKVKVLGTSFNTMAYPEEGAIHTTLVDGAVVVEEGALHKMLHPGQEAALEPSASRLSVGKADIRQVTAWRAGLFEFDHTDLAAIMRQLARWYDIEVVYEISPDRTPLGGSISRSLDLKEVLSLLEANGINHFKIEGKKVFVLP